MPTTPRMSWPFPSEDQDPWIDAFEALIGALDSSGFASREDRNLIMGGGGDVSFDSGTGVLSWDAALEIYSTVKGFVLSIPAGNVTLEDGQLFYVNTVRSPTSGTSLATAVASTVPSSDTAVAIGVRSGGDVFFRFGGKISNGETINLFAAMGGTDDAAIHDNVANEISGVTAKAVPVATDLVLIEDSEDVFNKKSAQVGSLPTTDPNAVHVNAPAEISGVAAKVPVVVGDYLLIEDSAAADAKKSITIGDLPVVYERSATFGVPEGTSSESSTLGRVTFAGSIIGLAVHMEDARTAGTVTVTVHVNGGAAVLTGVINVTDTEFVFDTDALGTNAIVQGDEVTVDVVGDASYTNAAGATTGLVANVTLVMTLG